MISIVSGTNRPSSNSRIISDIYSSILTEMSVPNRIVDLNQLPHDFIFSAMYDFSGKNEAYNVMAQHIVSSSKVVFVIPEYNGSFPGVLKAFIDGLPHPGSLKHKKGGMIGLSSGAQGSAIAMSNFNDILTYMGMHVLANRPKLSGIEHAIKNGELINQKYAEHLINHAKMMVEF